MKSETFCRPVRQCKMKNETINQQIRFLIFNYLNRSSRPKYRTLIKILSFFYYSISRYRWRKVRLVCTRRAIFQEKCQQLTKIFTGNKSMPLMIMAREWQCRSAPMI